MKYKKSQNYDEYEELNFQDDDYGYYNYKTRQKKEEKASVAILIKLLDEYEQMRYKLEQFGGNLEDMAKMSEIMKRKVPVQGYYETSEISLADPESLRRMISGLSDYHLDIRRRETRLPVYYLCRIKKGYWGESSIVVQDIYMSSDYKIDDERFVKLIRMGRESYFLRLSQFRCKLKLSSKLTDTDEKRKKDNILYELGRNIFQVAWHEDQRMSILTARYFGIKHFQNAIELLYLCLNSELCELRSKVESDLLQNYLAIYPCQPIADFITKIKGLEGSVLDKLPNQVLRQYSKISSAFNKFLKTEIKWGVHECSMPLYKILFGNFSRLESVGDKLRQNPQISKSKKELEDISAQVISDILSLC